MEDRRIKLPEELCNYVEGLMYEINARKDLCAFMLEKGMASDIFDKYHKEYVEYNVKYSAAKDEVSNFLLNEGCAGCNWVIDFTTGEAIINAK